jgi:hypothetical protein
MLHPNFTTDYDHYQGCPLAPIELNGARYDGFDDFGSLYSALQNVNYFEYSTTVRAENSPIDFAC